MGWLHSKHMLLWDMKRSNIFLFSGAQQSVMTIGDLGSSLRLDAFGVNCPSYLQRSITSYNDAAPEMLLAGIPNLPHIDLGGDI